MGQTLTHGIYLPDEGERNCYDGLASNWSILDGAVGTVAEHTSQIAGKAPAVHTHTKSDITDLLNSNFIPSANNSYDLGSSSYQWNNLYAKNYYYNGVAWGLDKSNTWSNYNSYSKGIELAGNRYAYILPEFAANYSGISLLTNSFGKSVKVGSYTTDASNNIVLDTSIGFLEMQGGTGGDGNIVRIQPRNGTLAELGTSSNKWKTLNGVNPGALSLPNGNNSDSIAVDITDWYIQDPDYPDDPTKKILDATNHRVDTAVPGWLHINFPNVAGNWAYVRKYAAGTNMDLQRIADGNASSDFANVSLIFPIYSSCYVRIKAKTATVRIFPCLGNV